jgi:hypothetical protein
VRLDRCLGTFRLDNHIQFKGEGGGISSTLTQKAYSSQWQILVSKQEYRPGRMILYQITAKSVSEKQQVS